MYDETGNIIGLKYNSNEYYYIKNAQNDIIGLLDSNLNKIVNYKYDSWGNIISITDNNGVDISNDPNHIGNINPYRYRSYYYDIESNLYYLQSRYYNPTWGRLINSDTENILIEDNENLVQYNLFTYGFNNSINMHDPDGDFALALAGGGIITSGFSLGGANFWNPVGWVILGTTVVITTGVIINEIAEHTKNARPSTKSKHEKGQATKKRNNGGEKGDLRRNNPWGRSKWSK